jgi:hypothetical protein
MSGIFRHFDGMAWPAPSPLLKVLEWRLRYQKPEDTLTAKERLAAAAVLCAYQDLIWKSRDRREAIISELRKGPSD